MSTETLTQVIGAGATVQFGSGTQFLIVQAASAISLKAIRLGDSSKNRVFTSVPAGFKFTADSPDDGFDLLYVTSVLAQPVTIAVGTDDVSYSNAVTVTGTALTQIQPSAAITDTPLIVTLTAQHALVPSNATRRRVTVFSDPTNTATVYFRVTGGANDIGFVSPGMSVEWDTVAGLDYRDPSAGGQKLYIAEES